MAGPLTAYYNGEYLTKGENSIQLDDVGFVLGTTVSERLRTFAGAVFRLDDHLERLMQSVDTVGLSDAVDLVEIREAVNEVAHRNLDPSTGLKDLGIAVLITPGSSRSGPNLIIYADPLPFTQMSTWYQHGVQLLSLIHI